MSTNLDRKRNRLHVLVHCTEQYAGEPTPGIVRRSAIRTEAFDTKDMGGVMSVEAPKYLAAAEACRAAGLPQPGVHLRYPTGLANGRTPALESMVERLTGLAANRRHDLFRSFFRPPHQIREVSAYIGGVEPNAGERLWANRGLAAFDSCIDKTAEYLAAIWPGMSFVAVDVSGVAQEGSWAEYAILRMQKLGMPIAVEPIRGGIWASRRPVPVFMEGRVFMNHSTRQSDRALFNNVLDAPRIIIQDDGTMSEAQMESLWLLFPAIEFVLPPERFTSSLLADLAKAGGGK
jgi:hypothetical protein